MSVSNIHCTVVTLSMTSGPLCNCRVHLISYNTADQASTSDRGLKPPLISRFLAGYILKRKVIMTVGDSYQGRWAIEVGKTAAAPLEASSERLRYDVIVLLLFLLVGPGIDSTVCVSLCRAQELVVREDQCVKDR